MSEISTPPSENNSGQAGRVDSSSPPPPPPYYWPYPSQRRPFWKRMVRGLAILTLLILVIGGISSIIQLKLGGMAGGGMETEVVNSGADDQVIAVYEVVGVINDRQADNLQTFCRQVCDDSSVKAVVLRVNSPGGGVSSCDRMHNMLLDLRDCGKKLVVSMGSVAASGGYYISAPAEAIYAEPTTITGSIGVLSTWVGIKGTLEKIGAKAVIVRSSKTLAWKAAPNQFEDPAEYQIESLQKMLDSMQERFEMICARRAGRQAGNENCGKNLYGSRR